MRAKKIKWLVYTVLVGLIPIFARIVAWTVMQPGTLEFFAAADFIAFGLVLHISIINELEHLQSVDPQWKTIQNGLGITFITFYGMLLMITLVGDKGVSKNALLDLAILLSIVSFSISYGVYYHLDKAEKMV